MKINIRAISDGIASLFIKKTVGDNRATPDAQAAQNGESAREVLKEQPHISAAVARSFVLDAGKAAAALETLHKNGVYEAGELRVFITSVHGMKSSLANVCEPGLSDAAYKLETAGRNNDIAYINAEIPAFLNKLRAVTDRLAETEENDEAEEADIDYEYLHQQLNAVIGACHIYDKRTVKALLSGLNQKVFPRSVKDLIDAMADQLISGDFDEVSNLAEKIIEMK